MSGLSEWVMFLALSAIAISTAASMLVTMSMYRAGLALMSSFVALAGLFILLDADLLAAIQVMMNVGGMLVMMLFMVMLMIDPGGEMMWDMKRTMHLPGFAAFSMSMPRAQPPEVQPSPDQLHAKGTTDWTCPMHPQVSMPGQGDCPICSMPLVSRDEGTAGSVSVAPQTASLSTAPEVHQGEAADNESSVYACPMHPEVRQPEPGVCPQCGMDLIPAQRDAEVASQGHATADYTCPMHPAVHQAHPGQCPKCGMNLVPASTSTSAAEVTGHDGTYTCPMHPEVRRDGPGTCPKCGMDLVLAEPGGGDDKRQTSTHRQGGGDMPMAQPSGMTPGMGMEMSSRQHYQMMVDMAMSTAQLPWALVLGVVSACALILLVVRTPWPRSLAIPTQDATVAVGELLLSRYMIGFEGAAFLILAGIVGAVVFATQEPGAGPRHHTQPHTDEHTYSCPMHPEVRQHSPGSCPRCGMDLVLVDDQAKRPQAGDQRAEYTCPMHPNVRQSGPGSCPECGMDLVPVSETAASMSHDTKGNGR